MTTPQELNKHYGNILDSMITRRDELNDPAISRERAELLIQQLDALNTERLYYRPQWLRNMEDELREVR